MTMARISRAKNLQPEVVMRVITLCFFSILLVLAAMLFGKTYAMIGISKTIWTVIVAVFAAAFIGLYIRDMVRSK